METDKAREKYGAIFFKNNHRMDNDNESDDSNKKKVIEKDPLIIPAKNLLKFRQYVEIQEQFNYIIMLHVLRMTLLIKLVNKSMNLKYQERLLKQNMGKERVQESGIDVDLFKINQVLKNEIGKDQDMIESYFQESLKAI